MTNFEKSNIFGKGHRPAAKFQQNDRLRRDIYAEIKQLNVTLHTAPRDSRHAAIIERFKDALIPSKEGHDHGRLPLSASKTRAPKRSKVLCVFYLVSCLVQVYWEYLDDESEENLATVKTALDVLKRINRDYDTLQVKGNESKGWLLEL